MNDLFVMRNIQDAFQWSCGHSFSPATLDKL